MPSVWGRAVGTGEPGSGPAPCTSDSFKDVHDAQQLDADEGVLATKAEGAARDAPKIEAHRTQTRAEVSYEAAAALGRLPRRATCAPGSSPAQSSQ